VCKDAKERQSADWSHMQREVNMMMPADIAELRWNENANNANKDNSWTELKMIGSTDTTQEA